MAYIVSMINKEKGAEVMERAKIIDRYMSVIVWEYRGVRFERHQKTPSGYYGAYRIGRYDMASSKRDAMAIIDKMVETNRA